MGAGRQRDFGSVYGQLAARDRYFPCPTAQSQPPVVAKHSVPLATTGEAQIRDPRLIRSRTSSLLPAFSAQRYYAVGMYTLPSATKVEPHVCDMAPSSREGHRHTSSSGVVAKGIAQWLEQATHN